MNADRRSQRMKKISLTTDGACIGNPGPGGWACLLRFGEVKKEFFGFDPRTTNNRMELMAAIQGLLALKEPCEVEITTDSEYLLHGITRWVAKWKRRHWWRKHEPVRNADLWMELDELAAIHKTTWLWTRGHAGQEDNTRCDLLAQHAAANQRSSGVDGRPHAPLRLGLGADFVPPKPQAGLFDGAPEDEDDEEN
jgi:ribonuclease HI